MKLFTLSTLVVAFVACAPTQTTEVAPAPMVEAPAAVVAPVVEAPAVVVETPAPVVVVETPAAPAVAAPVIEAGKPGTGPSVTLYKDALAGGIEDWSWDQDKKNLAVDDPALGLKSLMFDYKPNSGLSLYFGKTYPTAQFSKVTFAVNIGSNKSVTLDVLFQAKESDSDGDSSAERVTLTKSDEWETVTINFSQFKKAPAGLTRLNIMYPDGMADIKPIYFDDIKLEQ